MITSHEPYLHSSWGDKTPQPYEQAYARSPSPPFLAA
jgi:hypothetical protein